jgi:hypothetical protein
MREMEGVVGVATLTSGWASATTNLPLQGQSVRDPLGEFRHHLHLLIHGRSCGIPSCSITLVPLPLLTSFVECHALSCSEAGGVFCGVTVFSPLNLAVELCIFCSGPRMKANLEEFTR